MSNDSVKNIDFRISFCRAVACVLVVILHVASGNFGALYADRWWPTNIYDSLARVSVPLFFLITGATLLNRDEALSVFFKKRILRIFPALLVWSLIYLCWQTFHGKTFDNWALSIAAGPVKSHLWYLYAIIGVYAFLPVLRRFHRNATDQEHLYFIAMWFLIASVYPLIRVLYGIHWNMLYVYDFNSFVGYVGYLVVGAYLYRLSPANPLLWLAIFITGSILTMVFTYNYSMALGKSSETFYGYLTPLVVLSAAGLFCYLLCLPMSESRIFRGIVSTIAECSLGIYLVHIIVRDELANQLGITGAYGSVWFAIPVTSLIVLVCSWGVIRLARTVPPLRLIT